MLPGLNRTQNILKSAPKRISTRLWLISHSSVDLKLRYGLSRIWNWNRIEQSLQKAQALTVLEGPTDIDESQHWNWLAVKYPCRATADANTEAPF